MSAKRACLHFADRLFSHVVPQWGSGWLTAWRFRPCPSSSRHAPPPPRSKNGSNVCGAGKPEASYPLVQAFATDNAATVSIGQPSPTNGGRATIRVTPADGGEAATCTVDFGPLYQLTGLKVTPAKTAYKVGEAFDHAEQAR